MPIELKNYQRMEFPTNGIQSEEYMKHYLLLLLIIITNLYQIKMFSNKPNYTFRKIAQPYHAIYTYNHHYWVYKLLQSAIVPADVARL